MIISLGINNAGEDHNDLKRQKYKSLKDRLPNETPPKTAILIENP